MNDRAPTARLDAAISAIEALTKVVAEQKAQSPHIQEVHINAGGIGVWVAVTAAALMFGINMFLVPYMFYKFSNVDNALSIQDAWKGRISNDVSEIKGKLAKEQNK